jgi:hypothetical protein
LGNSYNINIEYNCKDIIFNYKGGGDSMTKFKRCYADGEQTIEIYEGNLDLILYNNKEKVSFYYYRFDPQEILGEPLTNDFSLIYRHQVEPYLKARGYTYEGLIKELLEKAWSEGMEGEYEM